MTHTSTRENTELELDEEPDSPEGSNEVASSDNDEYVYRDGFFVEATKSKETQWSITNDTSSAVSGTQCSLAYTQTDGDRIEDIKSELQRK